MISNSRLNVIDHSYQNPHNNKVHLISYPTLRTATKTDLRFESYGRNRFGNFLPYENSMYRYKTGLYRYKARMYRYKACLYRYKTVEFSIFSISQQYVSIQEGLVSIQDRKILFFSKCKAAGFFGIDRKLD